MRAISAAGEGDKRGAWRPRGSGSARVMNDESRKTESTSPEEDLRSRRGQAPEDASSDRGAEGGSQSSDAEDLPSHPTDSDSELGDTDQHSSA